MLTPKKKTKLNTIIIDKRPDCCILVVREEVRLLVDSHLGVYAGRVALLEHLQLGGRQQPSRIR